jgi:hypothetical protein
MCTGLLLYPFLAFLVSLFSRDSIFTCESPSSPHVTCNSAKFYFLLHNIVMISYETRILVIMKKKKLKYSFNFMDTDRFISIWAFVSLC